MMDPCGLWSLVFSPGLDVSISSSLMSQRLARAGLEKKDQRPETKDERLRWV